MKRKYSHQSKHLDICRRGHVGLLARTLECDGRRVRRHVTLGKQCEQFHGQGKDDRRVLLRRDTTQRLQIPQLQGTWRLSDDVRRFLQGACRFEFTFADDDLRNARADDRRLS